MLGLLDAAVLRRPTAKRGVGHRLAFGRLERI
jgi:hypothetical protein